MSVQNMVEGMPFGGQSRNPFNYVKVEQINRDISTEWLSLTDITQQLNLFNDESQDSYLSILELATRQAIEDYLGLSIFSTSYKVYYGVSSLTSSPLSFDLPEISQNSDPSLPSLTINSFGYYTDSFPPVFTTMDSSTYFYDPSGNKLIVQTLPTSINSYMTAPIVLTYSTVANPISTYPVIKQAGLLLLTHLYNNSSDTTDKGIKPIPWGVDVLLRPYKPLVM
jgi:hypothetical protein